MERSNSLSNNLNHHTIYAKRPMNLKDSWDHYNDHNDDDNFLGGFSWPPRTFTCTFCKREFRSAQALGGHMNVHRRDRARLQQSPSRDGQFYPGNFLNINLYSTPNPNPNPNPNFTSSSPQRLLNPPFTSKLPQFLSPSLFFIPSPSMDQVSAPTHHLCPRSANLAKMKSQETLFDGFSPENEFKVVKKGEIVRLNLDIGLLCESKFDDLDLELRLGYY